MRWNLFTTPVMPESYHSTAVPMELAIATLLTEEPPETVFFISVIYLRLPKDGCPVIYPVITPAQQGVHVRTMGVRFLLPVFILFLPIPFADYLEVGKKVDDGFPLGLCVSHQGSPHASRSTNPL